MKNFSNIISVFFHPIFVAFWGLLIVCYRIDYVLVNPRILNLVALLALSVMVLLPLFIIFLGLRLKVFSSLNFEKKEERYLPLLITGMAFYLTYYIINIWRIPGVIPLYVLGTVLTIIFAMLISLVWKISLHTLAIGSVIGMILGIASRLQVNLLPEVIVLLAVSGLVSMARLYLKAHTKAEVYIGFISGFVGMTLLFMMIN